MLAGILCPSDWVSPEKGKPAEKENISIVTGEEGSPSTTTEDRARPLASLLPSHHLLSYLGLCL